MVARRVLRRALAVVAAAEALDPPFLPHSASLPSPEVAVVATA
jgi:hypothetical protein